MLFYLYPVLANRTICLGSRLFDERHGCGAVSITSHSGMERVSVLPQTPLVAERFVAWLTAEVVNTRVRCEVFLHGLVAAEALVAVRAAVWVHALMAQHVPLVALLGRQHLVAFLTLQWRCCQCICRHAPLQQPSSMSLTWVGDRVFSV